MMSFTNRTFKDNKTGEIIKVIDSFENIAILENKSKVSTDFLSNPDLYTEQIDPSSFFNNQGAYNILAEKIKTIPSHLIQEDGEISTTSTSNYDVFNPASNESAIFMTTEEDEKAELARKYGVSMDDNSLQKQNQAFAKLLGEEDDQLPQPQTTQIFEPVQKIEAQRENTIPMREVIQQVEDPIITMFKRTKRNVDFKINVELSDKIPRLDFIEMMEDSYEISMIDFLAEEFTNKILEDPSHIRETIKSKIKQLVYGMESFTPPVNPQITDSVTQVEKHEPLSIEKEPVLTKDIETSTKPKTTRKPRTKKEITQ